MTVIPAQDRNQMLREAVAGTPISPDLLGRIVGVEDATWDPNEINPKSGARGLGQVLASTAADPGYGLPPLPADASPVDQLRFAARYLTARGKAAGMQDRDFSDPAKLPTALSAYHGSQADAYGVTGAEYTRRVLGMDAQGAATGLGLTPAMVSGGMADVQRWTAEKAAAQAPILVDMQANVAKERLRFDKMAENYKPVETTPAPPPPSPDPLQAFGSVAGVFAMIAAGFSHTPAVAAMNGMAGAINAAHDLDWERYQAHYRQWKDNTELMIQNHKLQADDMRQALETMQTDIATGTAMAKAVAIQTDDKIATKLLELGQYDKLAQLQISREQLGIQLQDHALKVQGEHDRIVEQAPMLAVQKAAAALQANPNDPKARADYEAALAVVAETDRRLAEAKQVGPKPGTPAYDIEQIFQSIKRNNPETPDDEARTQAVRRYTDASNKGPTSADRAADRDIKRERTDIARQALMQAGRIAEERIDVSKLGAEERSRHDRALEGHLNRVEDIQSNRLINDQQKAAVIATENARWHDMMQQWRDKTEQDRVDLDHQKLEAARETRRIKQAEQSGTLAAERKQRFDELKADLQAGGAYTNDTQVWDQVDRGIRAAKDPQFSAATAKFLAQSILSGDSRAAVGLARSPSLLAQVDNEMAAQAATTGMTGSDLTRKKTEMLAYAQGVKAFEAGGKLEPPVRSLDVAVAHFGTLGDAAKELADTGSVTSNWVVNEIDKQFGGTGVSTFDAVKGVVAAEVEKAVSGSAGAVSDREDLKANLRSASTAGQLAKVIRGYEDLMAGQLMGYENTYNRVQRIGGGQGGDFGEKFLQPETRVILGRKSTSGSSEVPPVPGARKAPDGNWYVPDPARPGKYLRAQ